MDTTRQDAHMHFERGWLRDRGELLGVAWRLTGSRAEAEDLVQDALLRAWVFRHRFEAGTNARAWMRRILFNTFVDGYRRRRRERELLDAVHSEDLRARSFGADDPVPGESLGDELRAALDALPEDFRRVVVLVDLEEHSYREAAAAIGCPVGTVMSRLHRARKAMKRSLDRHAPTDAALAEAA